MNKLLSLTLVVVSFFVSVILIRFGESMFFTKPLDSPPLSKIKICYSNPYIRDVDFDQCIYRSDTIDCDYFLDGDPSSSMTSYYWEESEYTDPVFACPDYCKKPWIFHFNRHSSLINLAIHSYKDYYSYDWTRNLRLSRPVKNETMLVLLSQCGWRAKLVKLIEMSNPHLIVKKEGSCYGESSVPRSSLMSKEDLDYISKFKYLFAVENSICENYVSEKIHKGLLSGTIPVIFDFEVYPREYESMRNHVVDLKETLVLSDRPLPSEESLKNFSGPFIKDMERICDFFVSVKHQGLKSHNRNLTQCMLDCENKFGCHIMYT